MEQWVTVEEVLAAKARFEDAIPGYVRPLAYAVARIDAEGLRFAHVNDVGGTHQLPAAVLASVCGYASGNATRRFDAAEFDRSIELLAPAEACTAFDHPNLWSWRALRSESADSSEFVAIFIGDITTPAASGEEHALRAQLTKPLLVMVTGEPGSGKTTLGLELSRALRIPFLSRDHVRGGLLATAGLWTNQVGQPSPREAAVEAFIQIVEKTAAVGVSAVIEFVVFGDRLSALERLQSVANMVVVRAECTNASERARTRDLDDPLLNRQSVLDALGYSSVDAYLSANAEQGDIVRTGMLRDFDLPLLPVTTDNGYDPSIEVIVDWVVEQTRR
ncbi:MAG: hypothetical protein Q8K63_07655 [Acidimicrobiales bacterium]|nr:hypothetical protein [Acidimicrobiales bacterium]